MRRARRSRPRSSADLLLEAHPGNGNADRIIRLKARTLVARAVALGWSGPPFDVATLAGLVNIRVRLDSTGLVQDAVLMADQATREFTIILSAGMPPERQRFNIGHEITHTFFSDCAETVQMRGGDKDAEVERLCDIGASEMLFPLGPFGRDAKGLGGPSLSALTELRLRYLGSWEATGNRLVSTAEEPCAMVVLSLRLKPTQIRRGRFLPGLEQSPKLRVDYRVASSHLESGFVPKDKSVPDGSLLYKLAEDFDAEPVVGTEDWSELNLGVVQVEALRLPTEDQVLKVLAIVRPAV